MIEGMGFIKHTVKRVNIYWCFLVMVESLKFTLKQKVMHQSIPQQLNYQF